MTKLNSKKANILMSLMALLLIITLAVGLTFSWVEGNNRGFVETGKLMINSGSSLIMRQDGGVVSNILIPACNLQQVSSSDGRNFFVPMEYNTSTTTDKMSFREGVSSDVNNKYIVVDFQLQAGENQTPVYLGAGTIVKCDNQDVADALRISFSTNDGAAPKVFKPSQMPGITEGVSYYPITAINDAGAPTTTETSSLSYGDFYYKGVSSSTPVFDLAPGETKNISIAIWLEGTETINAYAAKDLQIYIDFTTSVDDLTKYSFKDNTHGFSDAKAEYWITNKADNEQYETMMYLYDADSERYYAMTKTVPETYDSEGNTVTGSEWEIYVPKTIDNFYFRRYSISVDTFWNQWEPGMGSNMVKDPDGEYTYVAICGKLNGSAKEDIGCYGYWMDENDTIRVYFKNNIGWDKLKCYSERTDGSYATSDWKVGESEANVGNDYWPGKILNFSHNDTDGKAVYYIDLTGASKISFIQFNNSVNTAQHQIDSSKYFFNGFATWYEESASGYWLYTDKKNSLIYPFYTPTS